METLISIRNLLTNTNLTRLQLVLVLACLFNSCKPETQNANHDCEEIKIGTSNIEDLTNDYYVINQVSFQDKLLNLNISHSGGCEQHHYDLYVDPMICGTPPIFYSIRMIHQANDDPCEAWITKDLCFDLDLLYEGTASELISIGLYNTHQPDSSWVLN